MQFSGETGGETTVHVVAEDAGQAVPVALKWIRMSQPILSIPIEAPASDPAEAWRATSVEQVFENVLVGLPTLPPPAKLVPIEETVHGTLRALGLFPRSEPVAPQADRKHSFDFVGRVVHSGMDILWCSACGVLRVGFGERMKHRVPLSLSWPRCYAEVDDYAHCFGPTETGKGRRDGYAIG